MRTPRKNGSRKTTLKAWPLNTRFWNEPHRPQDRLRHGCDPGAGDRLAGAVVPRFALQRVRGARRRGFVLIAQLLLSQVPKFIFPTFGPAGFFPKLVRSRVDLLFARFWHYISPSWSTAPPSGGLGHIGARPAWRDWPPDSSPHEAARSSPRLPTRRGQAGITTHGLSRTSASALSHGGCLPSHRTN